MMTKSTNIKWYKCIRFTYLINTLKEQDYKPLCCCNSAHVKACVYISVLCLCASINSRIKFMNFSHWVWYGFKQITLKHHCIYLQLILSFFFCSYFSFFFLSFSSSRSLLKKKNNTQVLSAYSSTCTQHSFVTNTRHILQGLTYFISYAADLPSTNICAPNAADLPHLLILCCWSTYTC